MDVEKSVQGDGQRNKHNCITRRTIPTTTCIKCMYSLIFYMYKKFNYQMYKY